MKFNVGDKVLVRNWEDMEKQFGLSEDGNIKTNKIKFTPDMREFCGKSVIIAKIHRDKYYLIEEGTIKFKFTDDMLDVAEYSYI
jgi:hypothetical protein